MTDTDFELILIGKSTSIDYFPNLLLSVIVFFDRVDLMRYFIVTIPKNEFHHKKKK